MDKKQVRKLWAEALRSGRYKQGKEALHHVDAQGEHTYCCLGVACDLYTRYVEPLPVGAHLKSDSGGWIYSYAGQGGYAPPVVKDWLGLHTCSGTCPSLCTSLASLNDTGKTFAEIANLIDPPSFFVDDEQTQATAA